MNIKNKILIVAISALITISVFVFFVIPNIKEIKKINKNIHEQRIFLEKMYLRGQNIRQSRKNYNLIKNNIQDIEKIFYKKGNELAFIQTIEKIADLYNIKQIININNNKDETKEINKNDKYKKFRIDLDLKGSYPNLLQYIYKLQQLDEYFNIDFLNFNYIETNLFSNNEINNENKYYKSNLSPIINAKLSGLTYWK